MPVMITVTIESHGEQDAPAGMGKAGTQVTRTSLHARVMVRGGVHARERQVAELTMEAIKQMLAKDLGEDLAGLQIVEKDRWGQL